MGIPLILVIPDVYTTNVLQFFYINRYIVVVFSALILPIRRYPMVVTTLLFKKFSAHTTFLAILVTIVNSIACVMMILVLNSDFDYSSDFCSIEACYQWALRWFFGIVI